jgi:hypothetical protein
MKENLLILFSCLFFYRRLYLLSRIQHRRTTNWLWESTRVYARIGKCVYRILASSRIKGIFPDSSPRREIVLLLLAAPKA